MYDPTHEFANDDDIHAVLPEDADPHDGIRDADDDDDDIDDGDGDIYDTSLLAEDQRAEDPERRRLARQTMQLLQRVARRRARNENTTIEAVWPDILSQEQLDHERMGSDPRAADLANRITGNLCRLAMFRALAAVTAPKRPTTKKGGRRAA